MTSLLFVYVVFGPILQFWLFTTKTPVCLQQLLL